MRSTGTTNDFSAAVDASKLGKNKSCICRCGSGHSLVQRRYTYSQAIRENDGLQHNMMNATGTQGRKRHSLLILTAAISKKTKQLNGIAQQQFVANGKGTAAE